MATTYSGSVIIISAPSGAGKTSLVQQLIKKVDNLKISISHTTRNKRNGEQNGIDYNFVSEQQFFSLIEQDIFLEHAKVFNNYYGTSTKWLQNNLQQGNDVILEIDWQGAQQIRSQPLDFNIYGIFIIPPSKAELHHRLVKRQQDTPEVIKQRMQDAESEISHYNEYEYLIVNNDFATALDQLVTIIIANRLRTCKQQHLLASFKND